MFNAARDDQQLSFIENERDANLLENWHLK
jgi:hypothetical protein